MSLLSGSQQKRRNKLKKEKKDPYKTSIKDEFDAAAKEMKDAGVPKKQREKALKKNYKYFDSLGAFDK